MTKLLEYQAVWKGFSPPPPLNFAIKPYGMGRHSSLHQSLSQWNFRHNFWSKVIVRIAKPSNNKPTDTNTTFFLGCGLCPVKVFTGHGRIQTRVRNRTCPVKTFIGHKLFPFFFYTIVNLICCDCCISIYTPI